MRVMLILFLAFLLASTASAKQEIMTAGDYDVFFDVENTGTYSLNTTEDGPGFMIRVDGESGSAMILGREAKQADLESLKSIITDLFSSLEIDDVDLYTRTIDGYMAILGVGETAPDEPPIFIASYPMYHGAYGYALDVLVVSKFPWENGTESLLNTLSITHMPSSNDLPENASSASIETSKYGIPITATESNGQESADIPNSGGLTYDDHITFSDNSGQSIDDAIVIQNAKGEDDGVASEYYYLEQKYGERKVDWDLEYQSLVNEGDRSYDKMDIQLYDGTEITIYFDITDFFGKY